MIEYLDTLSTGALIGLGLGCVISLYVIARVIHFSYHFYIDHGFILVESTAHKEKITKTLAKLGKTDSVFAVGYPFAAIVCLLLVVLLGFIGDFWYVFLPVSVVVSFVFVPAIGIRLAAWNKRKKAVFMQKLDGTYDEST